MQPPIEDLKQSFIARSGLGVKASQWHLEFVLIRTRFGAVLRIRIRIHMFLGLLDPDPSVRGIDPDLDLNPYITKLKT
jgi:hypothetical protein